ncbi:MAG: DUF5011 domain-containing protein [Williamsia sp.]|nr:DUF5011 domain-containing protein [Williamsia sp.]
MTNLKKLLVLSLLCTGFACNKSDDFNYPEGTVGQSKIVYFPSVAVKGDKLVILQSGTAYTEPGVTALLNGQTVQFTTAGTVDATKAGIYNLTYTARNEQGYTASDWRTVVVIGTDVSTHDYSGTYARYVSGSPNGQTSTWTKRANGVYNVVNPGGATGVTATAVNYSGNNIAIPLQITEAGPFSSSGGVYNPSANPPRYDWVIINSGYGTAVRTFIKQ